MMNSSTIKKIRDRAAEEARRLRKQPLLVTEALIARAKQDCTVITNMPFIGDLVPDGWQRVRLTDATAGVYEDDTDNYGAFFVESSGFGRKDEVALTIDDFLEQLQPGLGYAVVEADQFQVKVGAFRKAP